MDVSPLGADVTSMAMPHVISGTDSLAISAVRVTMSHTFTKLAVYQQ